jgi:hypothetical protein
MSNHPTETACVQDKVIVEIQTTLMYFKDAEKRREGREERMLVAMESVAAQGATLHGLSLASERHDKALAEAFVQIRAIDQSTATALDMEIIKGKVELIELRHAQDHGEHKVTESRTKFWDGVKQQVTPYAIAGFFFIWWLSDKFNLAQGLKNLLKEFKG